MDLKEFHERRSQAVEQARTNARKKLIGATMDGQREAYIIACGQVAALRATLDETRRLVLAWPETQQRVLSVYEAQMLQICRVCKQPAVPLQDNPFICNYGEEFAHHNCLKPKKEEDMVSAASFTSSLAGVQRDVHQWAREWGFWDDQAPNIPEKLALIHSEVSEALEAHRNDEVGKKLLSDHSRTYYRAEDGTIAANPSQKHKKPDGLGIELADTVIRILDLAEYLKVDLGKAILEKMAYNATRPRKHNKLY